MQRALRVPSACSVTISRRRLANSCSGARISKHVDSSAPQPVTKPQHTEGISLTTSNILLGGAFTLTAAGSVYWIYTLRKQVESQKQALNAALAKARNASEEIKRLLGQQSDLKRKLEKERQARSSTQPPASDSAESAQKGSEQFHLQQRVFATGDLSVGGTVVVTRFTPGTVTGLDVAAERVIVRFDVRTDQSKNVIRVHPKRVKACPDTNPASSVQKLTTRIMRFLRHRRRWLISAVVCLIVLTIGCIGGTFLRDTIKESQLTSICSALRRAIESSGEQCVVCLDQPPGVVFMCCGHLLCVTCAEDRADYFIDRGCPTCRGDVFGMMYL